MRHEASHHNTPKRLLVRGFDSSHTYGVLQELLDRCELETFHFMFDPLHYPERPRLPVPKGTQYHERAVYDLQEGNFGEDTGRITPLDESFVREMAYCETIVLRMAERMLGPKVAFYNFRKALYLRQLRYWNHFLREARIDFALFHTLPHAPVDYIIYELCKKLGIPTLYFDKTPVTDSLFHGYDWEECGSRFGARYKELKLAQGTGAVELRKEFDEQYRKQTSGEKPSYVHVEIEYAARARELALVNRIKRSATRFTAAFKQKPLAKLGQFVDVDYWHGKKHSIVRENEKLFAFYNSHVSKPDFSEKFVFVPLHYQPEATTSPMSGAFADQVLIAQMIQSVLPSGWKLYVKEHPGQEADCRDVEFYEDLLKLPDVRLIARDVPSVDLIAHCQAIGTGTGTAGWESLFRQKPVLLFGHCYYQYAPGVHRISSTADCREAIGQVQRGAHPTRDELRLFLRAMQDECLRAVVEPVFCRISKLPREQNVRNLVELILREMEDRRPRNASASRS
ncbi:MAG: hypothetical protein HY075_10300 [Deltaproteobacteria bacterium]|nr:hypothetical protein [Deltaproteobacteria bacterium]